MAFSESLDEVVAANDNGLLGTHGTWARVRLRDIASVLNGFAFKSSEFSRDEGVPLLRIRDVLRDHTEASYTGSYDSQYLVQSGTLVVGMDGDFNCALWAGPPALLNQRVCRIDVAEAFYSLRFLRYVLPGYLSAINAATSSVTVKHLSSRTVEDIPLPLPPLNEQRRIVEEIETQFTRLDAAVAALMRARANLKRYRASVLAAACSGRLVPTDAELARQEVRAYDPAPVLLERILTERRARREAAELSKLQAKGTPPKNDAWKSRYKESASPDTADLPELPEGWTWTSAERLCDVQGGIQKQPKRAPNNNAYPMLRVANVFRGRLDLEEIHSIELFGNELERLRLQAGDLLIVEGNGSISQIGRMAIWRGEIADCVHQNHIIRARPVHGVLAKYLETYWNSPVGTNTVTAVASSTSGLHTLSVGKIEQIPVPLPPLAEQHRIVAEVERRLSVLDDMERAIATNLQRAARTRQAILKRAFAGQLVPQDPNDEPASILLERIRAEHAAQTLTTKHRAPRRRINAKQHMLPLGTEDEE